MCVDEAFLWSVWLHKVFGISSFPSSLKDLLWNLVEILKGLYRSWHWNKIFCTCGSIAPMCFQ